MRDWSSADVLRESLSARIVRHASRLLASEIASRVLAFFTTVYLARTLSVAGFGMLAYAQALLGYLAVISDWGLSTYGTRAISRAPPRWPDVWGRVVSLRASFAFLFTAAAAAAVWLWVDDGTMRLVVGATLLAAIPAGFMPEWVFRGLERMGLAAALVAGQAALILLGIVAVIRQASDLPWVPIVRLAASAAIAAAGLLLLRRMRRDEQIRDQDHRSGSSLAVRHMIVSGAVLLAANLAVMVYSNIDIVMLRTILGDKAVGWYSGAQRMIQLPMGGFYTLTVAALPVLTRTVQLGGDVFGATLRPLLGIAAAAGTGAAVVLWAWRHEVVELVLGPPFAPAADPLAYLAFAIPLDFLVAVKGTSYVARGWETPAMVCVAIAALAKVVLNLALIPRLGTIGAAWATLGTYGILLVAYVAVLDRRSLS